MSAPFLERATGVAILVAALLAARTAGAHCDRLDGPVVTAARTSLERSDVTPVLRWVRLEDEPEIRKAFESTLAVRKLGPQARELADNYFFETLVRVHRAGEGAPFTGIKPAGAVQPAVALADQALAQGSVDSLVREISSNIATEIRERFECALAAKKDANTSVQAGRAYVAAYVELLHYTERLHQSATTAAHHETGVTEDAATVHEHR